MGWKVCWEMVEGRCEAGTAEGHHSRSGVCTGTAWRGISSMRRHFFKNVMYFQLLQCTVITVIIFFQFCYSLRGISIILFICLLLDMVYNIGTSIVDNHFCHLSNVLRQLFEIQCSLLVEQGKGQRRVIAVHVVDALFICGTDVRQLHYNERQVFSLLLIVIAEGEESLHQNGQLICKLKFEGEY